jgi:hypothetical protein
MVENKQVIFKNGKVFCESKVPYDKKTLTAMKAAGYKVKEV